MADLLRLPIFSLCAQGQKLFSSIRKTYMRGPSLVIFITESDDVYGLGSNGDGLLALGHKNPSLLPEKIDELCQKEVVDIAFGSQHAVAITKAGKVYSWGLNNCTQLGYAGPDMCSPTLVQHGLQDKQISKVACGANHSMVLTDEGEIFTWGYNIEGQLGIGSKDNMVNPTNVSKTQAGSSVKAVSIGCGENHSLAIMENGVIHAWGENSLFELGMGADIAVYFPAPVPKLEKVNIQQIACGVNHSLAVSESGQLYTWGNNSNGKLGTGNLAQTPEPVQIVVGGLLEKEKFIEVAASNRHHISAAVSNFGKVYVWGRYLDMDITDPMLTNFSSTDAVFLSVLTTWRMYCAEESCGKGLKGDLADAFDCQETSDLKIVVGGKQIFVHKALLRIRSEYFQSMFKSNWKESEQGSINITTHSYNTFHAFLKYLYTDELDDMDALEAFDLFMLSNAHCDDHLKRKCELQIHQGITSTNVATIYSLAFKMSAKRLEEYCYRYAVNNLTEVIQSEAFFEMEDTIAKNFMRQASRQSAFKT